MLAVHLYIHVKPDELECCIEATIKNARNSLQEPGGARFDLTQQQGDPTRFVLVEVYRAAEAPARHKETAHYALGMTGADFPALVGKSKNASSMKGNPLELTEAELTQILRKAL